MATATRPVKPIRPCVAGLRPVRTLADVLDDLGGIPPERVILDPPPGQASEADVHRLEGALDKRICELIDGTLVEKAVGTSESSFSMSLAIDLGYYVKKHKLGTIIGEQGMFRTKAKNIRIPDLSFYSWATLPEMPTDAIWNIAPDLAVEVLSPSNTRREMEGKRIEYFASGVKLVWEVFPDERCVRAYTTVDQFATITSAELLQGGDIVPGFAVPVADLFAFPKPA